jgi:hypothetical protein
MQKTFKKGAKWLLATLVMSLTLLVTVTFVKTLNPSKTQSSRKTLRTVGDRLMISSDAQMQIYSTVMKSIPSLTSLQYGTIFTLKEHTVQVTDIPVIKPLAQVAKVSKEKSLRGAMVVTAGKDSINAIPTLILSRKLLEDNGASETLPSPVIIAESDAPPRVDGQVVIVEEVDTSKIDALGSSTNLGISEQPPALQLTSDSASAVMSETFITGEDGLIVKAVQSEPLIVSEQAEPQLTTPTLPLPSDSAVEDLTTMKAADIAVDVGTVRSEPLIVSEQAEPQLTTPTLPLPSDSAVEDLTTMKAADIAVNEGSDSTSNQPPIYVTLLPAEKMEENPLSDAVPADGERTDAAIVTVSSLDAMPLTQSDVPAAAATDSSAIPAAPYVELVPLGEGTVSTESKSSEADRTTVTQGTDAEEHYTYRSEGSDINYEMFETASQFFKSFINQNVAAIFSQKPREDTNEVDGEQII